MSKSVVFWLMTLFVFSGAAAVYSGLKVAQKLRPAGTSSTRQDPQPAKEDWLTEFTLTERSGEEFSSRDLRGKVWVASFFFTICPGSCKAQNLEVMMLHNEYAKQGVKFLSISCDPKTDTVEKLREYSDSFHAGADSWYFLRGDLLYVRRIGAEIFSVWVDEKTHMDRLMVVDKWGNVRGHFDWHDKAQLAQMKDMLSQLLIEESPPDDVTPLGGSSANQTLDETEEAGEEGADEAAEGESEPIDAEARASADDQTEAGATSVPVATTPEP
jgi:cytochrome oxidase Cu insertion factor (SCO1/SenC/PrrC family)